jgi:hypothetical protein
MSKIQKRRRKKPDRVEKKEFLVSISIPPGEKLEFRTRDV